MRQLAGPIHLLHGVPYLVYLPGGGRGLARSETAENAWAVAHLLPVKTAERWKVRAILDVASRFDGDIAATAERLTEEDVARYVAEGSVKFLVQ